MLYCMFVRTIPFYQWVSSQTSLCRGATVSQFSLLTETLVLLQISKQHLQRLGFLFFWVTIFFFFSLSLCFFSCLICPLLGSGRFRPPLNKGEEGAVILISQRTSLLYRAHSIVRPPYLELTCSVPTVYLNTPACDSSQYGVRIYSVLQACSSYIYAHSGIRRY